MRTLPLIVLVCVFTALLGEAQATPAWGSPTPGAKPAPCGTGGSITETASSGFIATFEIVITDCNGKEIPKSRQLIEGVGNVSIKVPDAFYLSGRNAARPVTWFVRRPNGGINDTISR